MLDRKSIYTLNKKDPEAIIYSNAYRRLVRLTRADFDTEEEFLKWKTWSDNNYHTEENGDHVEANHTTSSSELPDYIAVTDGPEIIVEQRIERLEHKRCTTETLICIKQHLTDKQFRRLWMRYVDGLNVGAIARQEGTTHSSISESISSAKKKIIRFLYKRQNDNLSNLR